MFKIILLSLAMFASAVPAHATQIEVGAGIARAQTHGNGIWYQDGLPHQLHLQSPAFLVGATGEISEHWSWHVDAIDLGSYSVDSTDTYADQDYSVATHRCVANCDKLISLHGSGRVYGIAATIEAHTTGSWQFGVEAGPMLYHSSWAITSPNYDAQVGSTAGIQGGSTCDARGWTAMTGGITRSCAGWKPGAVIGVSVSHGPLTLSVRQYIDGLGYHMGGSGATSDGWPPIWTSQTVGVLIYEF